MAALDRNDVEMRPRAEQREIADEIEDLVAHDFVVPAQRRHRTLGREDESVIERAASR